MSKQKLYHFYHIYSDGYWTKILFEHLNVLRRSQLLQNLDGFYIGITGSDKNRVKVEKFLKYYTLLFPFKYQIKALAHLGWEQTTQDALYEFSLENNGYVLYAHTKGASAPSNFRKRWRNKMAYYNIKMWREAISLLANNRAVGCYWLLPKDVPNGYFFAGNYWWAHLDLIRTLGKPERNSRFDAECWLGSKYSKTPFPVYDMDPNYFEFAKTNPSLCMYHLKRIVRKIVGEKYFAKIKSAKESLIGQPKEG